MPITWSEAVADADNRDDEQLRQRMMDQVDELRPLIESFIANLRSRGIKSYDKRHISGADQSVWFTEYGNWDIDVLFDNDPMPSRLLWFGPKEGIRLVSKSDSRFHKHAGAMERTKEWVPRALVEAMREMGIPVPR